MLDKLRRNVCKIIINDGEGQGTGFLISNEFILTAYHVVEDAIKFEIFFENNESIEDSTLYKKDKKLDIAVLKLKNKVDFYEKVDFLDVPLTHGEEWMTFGYPVIKIETGEVLQNEALKNHTIKPLPKLQEKGYDLELNFDRKLSSYRGLSGAPLIVKNKIAGIINSELMDKTAKELNALSFKYMQIFIEEFEIINIDGIEDEMEHIHFERILRQIYPNVEISNLLNPISKNEKEIIIVYSFFNISDPFGMNMNFLFLSNRINRPQTINHIEKSLKEKGLKSLPKNTTIVISKKYYTKTLNQRWKTGLENLIKKLNYGDEVKFFYLDDLLSMTLLKRDLKEKNSVFGDFFIEPTYETLENEENKNSAINLLSNWTNKEIPLSVVLGEGGIGKTLLLKNFINTINKDETSKIALYIDANSIASKFLDSIDDVRNDLSNFSNLLKLYYTDIVKNEQTEILRTDNKLIDILVSSGNLIVIIDGLDEIASTLKEKFRLEEFINSIFEINKILGYTKIIISSRTTYWKSNFKENRSLNLVTIKGFSEENVKEYFTKFFKGNDDVKYSLAMKELQESPFKDNGYYWPFPVYLIADEINSDNYEKFNKDIQSQYIENKNNKNEFLIARMLMRDKKRHKLSIEIDEFLDIFSEIIFEHNGVMHKNNMQDYIETMLPESSLSLEILDHNPLLRRNGDNYEIIDFLSDSFILIFLINSIKLNDFSIKKAKIFARYYNGENKLIKIIKAKSTASNIEKYLKMILVEYQKNDENKRILENAISTLLYILFESSKEDIEEKTKIISKIFHSEYGISNLFIIGKFYPLNFENKRVYNSKFKNYIGFMNSKINKDTRFIGCEILFDKVPEKKKQDLTDETFDTCILSDNLNLLLKTKDTREVHKEKIKRDILILVRNFFKRGRHEHQAEADVSFDTRSSIKFKRLLKSFKDYGIMIVDNNRTAPYILAISEDFMGSISQVVHNDYFDNRLDSFINKLLEENYE